MSLTKRVPVLLSPEEYTGLKNIAKRKKRTMGSLIREAVDGALRTEEQKKRLKAFIKEKAKELDMPAVEAVRMFLEEWRTQELLRSSGKIKLDINLKKSREDRGLNR